MQACHGMHRKTTISGLFVLFASVGAAASSGPEPSRADLLAAAVYFEGVPLDEARDLSDADVARLIELLDDPSEIRRHPNVLVLLGLSGSPAAFDAIADCAQRGDSFICAEAGPELCPCEGPVLVCQEGCSGDADCDAGETCNAQRRCVPSNCAIDADCPQEFVCEGNGTCARRACGSDAECEQGFCVQGLCYDRLGQCMAIPA